MFGNTTTEKAAAQIDKWAARELQLTREVFAAEDRIKAAEMAAGEALLDDSPDGSAVADVARVRAEVAVQRAALVACRKRRLDAIATKRASDTAALRKQAGDYRAELENVERKTTKLLRELSALQDVAYTSLILQSQPKGELIIQGYHVPRSEKLRAEIAAMEVRAGLLESDKLTAEGEVDMDGITSVDELVLTVLKRKAVVPDAAAILTWAAACEKNSDLGPFGDLPRRYRLQWRNGIINDRDSYTLVVPLAPQNAPAATFKSVPRTPEERAVAQFNAVKLRERLVHA
ncbi:MAG TPA: hypothetical protein VME43_10315 [Bryobacteraceae bacterium]|nr:hypothetical protein [Bryobacteraceae bacterium]